MINIIGIGLEGLAGLGEIAKEKIAQATVLVGSPRHLQYIPQSARARRVLLDNFWTIAQDISQLEDIAILVSGDPLFFGLGRILLERFPAEQLAFYPHLTSIQLAFNRIKQTWQDAQIISVHGRSLLPLISALQEGKEKIAILCDPQNNPQAITLLYLQLDLPVDYQFWICSNLGDPSQEKICSFQGEQINELINQEFPSLSVLILLRQTRIIKKQSFPVLGLKDEFFHSFADRPGLMTKRETRLQILAELELSNEQTIWDIGSGTGSVSIEIARLSPSSRIYSIEKTDMGITLINKNIQTFSLSNVHIVHGSAPDVLEDLPNPDRIFIGGSGGKLEEILNHIQSRLSRGGRLVLALATLEHTYEALTWLKQQRWQYDLIQMQISRSVSLGDLTRLIPLNPITIVSASNETY